MSDLKSNSLRHVYTTWVRAARENGKEAEIEFVDSVYELCERNYENGGDEIVEAWTPTEILDEFTGEERTLEAVKRVIGLRVENATNFREGTDSDPEIERLRRFENQWED